MEQARHLRPMGVGDLLDEMIRLFRRSFLPLVAIGAVLLVPFYVLQLIQLAVLGPSLFDFTPYSRLSPRQLEQAMAPVMFYSISSAMLGLLLGLLSLVMMAAFAYAISERYLGRSATTSAAYRLALARFWRLLGAALLGGLALVLLTITIIGIPFAIYFGIRWTLAIPAIALEGCGARSALSRSSDLVRGSWWRVLGVLVVAGIIQYFVAGLPAGFIGIVLGVIGGLLGPGAIYTSTLLSTAVGGFFNVLTYPITPIVLTLLYYDMRIRKEGFDLQMLVGRLEQR